MTGERHDFPDEGLDVLIDGNDENRCYDSTRFLDGRRQFGTPEPEGATRGATDSRLAARCVPGGRAWL